MYINKRKVMKAKFVKNTIDESNQARFGFMLNDDLEEGFSESDFENYVYANESDIKDNMERYGWDEDDITSIGNPYDFANILGCDSRAVHDIELRYWTKALKALLF